MTEVILITPEKFLVNTFKSGEKGDRINDKIFVINMREVFITPIKKGGFNNDVPLYCYTAVGVWVLAAKKAKPINLANQPVLFSFYEKVRKSIIDEYGLDSCDNQENEK